MSLWCHVSNLAFVFSIRLHFHVNDNSENDHIESKRVDSVGLLSRCGVDAKTLQILCVLLGNVSKKEYRMHDKKRVVATSMVGKG